MVNSVINAINRAARTMGAVVDDQVQELRADTRYVMDGLRGRASQGQLPPRGGRLPGSPDPPPPYAGPGPAGPYPGMPFHHGMAPPYSESDPMAFHPGAHGFPPGVPPPPYAVHGGTPRPFAGPGPMAFHPRAPAHTVMTAPAVLNMLKGRGVNLRKFHADLHRLLIDRQGRAEFERTYATVIGTPAHPFNLAATGIYDDLSRLYDHLDSDCKANGFHPPSSRPSADLAAMSPQAALYQMACKGVNLDEFRADLQTMEPATLNMKYANVLTFGDGELDAGSLEQSEKLSALYRELTGMATEAPPGYDASGHAHGTGGAGHAAHANVAPTAASDANVLGLQFEKLDRNKDRATIRRAYRELGLKWHPDRNKAPEAAAKFVEIKLSYERLIKLFPEQQDTQ